MWRFHFLFLSTEGHLRTYEATYWGKDKKIRGKWGKNNLPTPKKPLYIDSTSLTVDLLYNHPSELDPAWALRATYVNEPPLVMKTPFKSRFVNWLAHVGMFVATGGVCAYTDSRFFGMWTFIAVLISLIDACNWAFEADIPKPDMDDIGDMTEDALNFVQGILDCITRQVSAAPLPNSLTSPPQEPQEVEGETGGGSESGVEMQESGVEGEPGGPQGEGPARPGPPQEQGGPPRGEEGPGPGSDEPRGPPRGEEGPGPGSDEPRGPPRGEEGTGPGSDEPRGPPRGEEGPGPGSDGPRGPPRGRGGNR